MTAPRGDKWEQDIEARLRALEQRRPLANTGMSSASPGVLDVSGDMRLVDGTGALLSSSFDGTDFAHPGTAGNYFGDDGVVLNNAYFRPGSVTNDALTEPLRAARLHADAQNFAVPTGSGTQIMSASVAVPAGYSQALVLNIAVAVTAFNSTSGTDFLYGYGLVNGASAGWQIGSSDVPAGKTGVAYDLSSQHLTGLSGGTVTVTGYVSSAFNAWAANGSNVANLDAAILFLR